MIVYNLHQGAKYRVSCNLDQDAKCRVSALNKFIVEALYFAFPACQINCLLKLLKL